MEFVLLKRCECDFSVTVFLIWKWNAFHGRWQLLFRFEASRSALWRRKDQIIALWYNKAGRVEAFLFFVFYKKKLFHSKHHQLKKKLLNSKLKTNSRKGQGLTVGWVHLFRHYCWIKVEFFYDWTGEINSLTASINAKLFLFILSATLSKQECVSFFPSIYLNFPVVTTLFRWLKACLKATGGTRGTPPQFSCVTIDGSFM